jgi:hypothetical protein
MAAGPSHRIERLASKPTGKQPAQRHRTPFESVVKSTYLCMYYEPTYTLAHRTLLERTIDVIHSADARFLVIVIILGGILLWLLLSKK